MPRSQFVTRFRQRLVRQYTVRFHMSLLLAATMAAGVLSSKLLLLAGLHSVLLRYPLAVFSSYLVFTGLARLWVAYVLTNAVASQGHSFFSGRSSNSSALDFDLPLGGGSGSSSSVSFGGGDSGGAGASDSWGGDLPAPQLAAQPAPSSSSGFHFPSIDLDIDFDDGIWILIALAILALVLACAGGYLIWAAPEILPDLALNALLAGSLTGAAKRAQAQGWLVSVLRATWLPFFFIFLATAALAYAVHHTCPGADRLVTALACPDSLRPHL